MTVLLAYDWPDRFAQPWLLALAALPLLAWAITSSRRSGIAGIRFPIASAGDVGLGSWRTSLRWIPGLIRIAAVLLIVVAIARPQDVEGLRRERTDGIAIQLVIDRSGSMNEPTVLDEQPVRRLDAVKQLATEFVAGNGRELKGRDGDLVGVLAFGSYADTVAPPVRDIGPLPELIDRIEVLPSRSETSTAIGDALALAAARLEEAERSLKDDGDESFTIKSKIIILLTDGAETSGQFRATDAAQFAADRGIKIYSIGLGAPSARGPSGVDTRLLRSIGEISGGRAWVVDSATDLRDVYEQIDQLERTDIRREEYTQVDERYVPFAIVAFALLGIEALLRSLVFRSAA